MGIIFAKSKVCNHLLFNVRIFIFFFVILFSYINDAVPAIFVVLLFFVIPADPMHLKSSAMLLDWKTTQERVSWGIILLLGGGFAMALGCEESGLSLWIGNKLANLSTLPQPLITIIMCAITLVMTEMTSNTATCTILLPVIKQMVSHQLCMFGFQF